MKPRPPMLCSRYCNALIAAGELGPRCPHCDDSERWVVWWARMLAGALTPEATGRARKIGALL